MSKHEKLAMLIAKRDAIIDKLLYCALQAKVDQDVMAELNSLKLGMSPVAVLNMKWSQLIHQNWDKKSDKEVINFFSRLA